jgi:hypothetical protein
MTSLPGGASSSSKKTAKTARSKDQPGLPFEVRGSSIQGLGGFATRRIAKGDRIIEYVGERIKDEQADERYDDEKMDRHHTFLFSLGDGTSIDAAVNGNEARFINHSCAPNCEAINDEARIFIEALRDIEPGEELLYDYAYERGGDPDDDEDREEIAKFYVCKCGAPTCRGTILAPEKPKKKRATAAASKRKAAPANKGKGKSPPAKAPKKKGAKAEGGKARSKGR